MVELKCRVCGRVEEVWETDDEDYVCSVCCRLGITDQRGLREFLEQALSEVEKNRGY